MRREVVRLGCLGVLWISSWVFPVAAQTLVTPAEFDPVDELLLGNSDPYLVLEVYRDTIQGLSESPAKDTPIRIVCDSKYVAGQLRYELHYAGVNLDAVQWYLTALDTVWIRDYGPVVAKGALGQRVVVDANYYWGRPTDDKFPSKYAKRKNWPYIKMDLDFEGGNLMTDGLGNAYTSDIVYSYNTHLTKSQIDSWFRRYLGSKLTTFKPLAYEGTGHIDMFAKLLSATTVLVSKYPSSSPDSPMTEAAAAAFAGKGFTVLRLPAWGSSKDYENYTNGVTVNGVALVPSYAKAQDSEALAVYASAGYHTVPVESRVIIPYGGTVHCVTMQIPK